MKVTLKMWTPKGTMVEIDTELPQGAASEDVLRAEAYWLQAGFTSQRPDHTYPVKEQVIEGIVVVDGTDFNGNAQKVLYLYTDNRNLEYSEYRVYPEDEWYPKLASLVDMDDSTSIALPKSRLMNKGSGYQQVNRKATFVPARNAEGQLIYRKDKDGNRKSWPEYRVQSVEGFGEPSANGNGAPAQSTRNAGATPDTTWSYPDLIQWAEDSGACANEFEAKNSLKKLVRELFGLAPGKEGSFFPNGTPDKHETLKNNYILHQQEKLTQKMSALEAASTVNEVAEGEEIPF